MKIEVLVSTMNQSNLNKLKSDMKITSSCVIINQITKDNINKTNSKEDNNIFISIEERGLSKSRNRAIKEASKDICVIADDDLYYELDYEKIITDAYNKYKDADIIAFVVDNEDKKHQKKIFKKGRIGYLKSMKLQSVQITFKRSSIVNNNITFDEEFGAGSKYYWGEENIFLFDCLRKKLKIYYVPIKIATLKISDSTWNKEISKENSIIRGSIFYRMSKKFYLILIIQFAIRKKKLCKNMSVIDNIKYMLEGVKHYKNIHGGEINGK